MVLLLPYVCFRRATLENVFANVLYRYVCRGRYGNFIYLRPSVHELRLRQLSLRLRYATSFPRRLRGFVRFRHLCIRTGTSLLRLCPGNGGVVMFISNDGRLISVLMFLLLCPFLFSRSFLDRFLRFISSAICMQVGPISGDRAYFLCRVLPFIPHSILLMGMTLLFRSTTLVPGKSKHRTIISYPLSVKNCRPCRHLLVLTRPAQRRWLPIICTSILRSGRLFRFQTSDHPSEISSFLLDLYVYQGKYHCLLASVRRRLRATRVRSIPIFKALIRGPRGRKCGRRTRGSR